ncbi:MAG: aminotransferase class V-fold PLP-dependent enzyme [Bacteroidales bacterium]|nr:aminotransferase class V-fold PLP-dependent enzyme [Bacteroidales bacterium]
MTWKLLATYAQVPLLLLRNKTLHLKMLDFNRILQNEETLDPENWDDMRRLGHQMVEDMMDYLQHIRQAPVWRKPTEAAKANLKKDLPTAPEDPSSIYEGFKSDILPFTKGNIHPRFWAWVQGTGTPLAVLAELLAAAMNPNVAIGDHAAMYVDQQVIDWCKQMLGYPADASGMLVSGGSIANITALIVARNAYQDRLRKEGLHAVPGQMVLYASSETHSCNVKAAEVMGLGSDAVRKVQVNGQFQMDMDDLRQRIAEDRAAGLHPFCVVGNAGTVNTGAIDPLAEIAAICEAEKLWFHVDGAFGALAKLVPEYEAQLKPIEQADSLAFDLHKWMYMPYEVGCFLVKNAEVHRAAFASQPSYLLSHERGLAAGPDPYGNYGMELSRGFKSLKVWMSLKEHGIEKFRRLIRQNIAQAFYLESLIKKETLLELATPVTMNIACFRFKPNEGMDTEALNLLNKEILMRLHEQGLSAPSSTVIGGKYYIRMANVNHRSRKDDFEALVADTLRIGAEIIKS